MEIDFLHEALREFGKMLLALSIFWLQNENLISKEAAIPMLTFVAGGLIGRYI